MVRRYAAYCENFRNVQSSECTAIKQLQKVQSAFIKGTNTLSWSDARQRYPFFATTEQLEPFISPGMQFSSGYVCSRTKVQVGV